MTPTSPESDVQKLQARVQELEKERDELETRNFHRLCAKCGEEVLGDSYQELQNKLAEAKKHLRDANKGAELLNKMMQTMSKYPHYDTTLPEVKTMVNNVDRWLIQMKGGE